AIQHINEDLHLKKPEWLSAGSGLTLAITLQHTSDMPVRVTYYPPDPSEAMLVNGEGEGEGAGLVVLFSVLALFFDATSLLLLGARVSGKNEDRRRAAEEAARPKIAVAADLCDKFIPLLDEGLAAGAAVQDRHGDYLKERIGMMLTDFADLRR